MTVKHMFETPAGHARFPHPYEMTGEDLSLTMTETSNEDSVENSPDVVEERFRVDRRKLELMLQASPDAAEDFFQNLMEATETHISWPSRLKIGAKSKKDPHIKICGDISAVSEAKEKILNVLDTKTNRVTLKMDVAHTEHSHVIGKGGNNIKKVMRDTGCHIHFPDSNRNNNVEKSNQVSLAGQPHGVENARSQIRELLPLVFTFELPIAGMLHPPPDPNSQTLQHIQQVHNVTLIFKQRPRLFVTSVIVRGTVNNAKLVKEATALVMDHLTGSAGVTIPVNMTLEIAPQHHLFILGRSGNNIKQIMQQTGATVHFPDPNTVTPQRKGTVYISGGIDNVFLARQHLVGCLPLVLMFDLKEDFIVDQQKITYLQEHLDIFLSIKPKPKQPSKSVIVKSVERNAANLFEARRILLGLEQDERLPLPNILTSSSTSSSYNQDIALQMANLSMLSTNLVSLNNSNSVLMMNNGLTPSQNTDQQISSSQQWMSSPQAMFKPLMLVPSSHVLSAVQPSADFYKQYNALKDLNQNNAFIRVPSPSEKGASSTNSSSDSPLHSPCSSPIQDFLSNNVSVPNNLSNSHFNLQSLSSMNLNAPSTVFVDEIKKISPNNSGSAAELMSINKPLRHPVTSNILNRPKPSPPPGLPHPPLKRESPISAFQQFNRSPINSDVGSLLLNQNGFNPCQLFGQLPNGSSLNNLSPTSTDFELSPDKRAPGAERPSPAGQLFNSTQQQQIDDYEQKKIMASKAMQKKPEGESRTPTDFWSGLGFSKSMPDSAIRDRLKKNHIKNYKAPSVLTELCEIEGDTIGCSIDRDPWKDSPLMNGITSDYQDIKTKNQTEKFNGQLHDDSSRANDLDGLFSNLGLTKYADLFEQQEIDMSTFLTLNDLDLKELGITTFGARRKMLLAIAELNKNGSVGNQSASSARSILSDRGISSPPVPPMLIRRNEIPSQSGRW